jgi:hypothetical protein
MAGSVHGLIWYYHSICLEGLRKTTRSLGQYSRSTGQDLSQVPPEHEAGMPTTRPRHRYKKSQFTNRTNAILGCTCKDCGGNEVTFCVQLCKTYPGPRYIYHAICFHAQNISVFLAEWYMKSCFVNERFDCRISSPSRCEWPLNLKIACPLLTHSSYRPSLYCH